MALVGDRAQLSAVGRGGVLDMAAHIRGRTFDMTGVRRFTNPDYAALTVQMRAGTDPAAIFDQLHTLELIRLHDSDEFAQSPWPDHRRQPLHLKFVVMFVGGRHGAHRLREALTHTAVCRSGRWL